MATMRCDLCTTPENHTSLGRAKAYYDVRRDDTAWQVKCICSDCIVGISADPDFEVRPMEVEAYHARRAAGAPMYRPAGV